MKKLILSLVCLLFVYNAVIAAPTVYDDNYVENPNYVLGNKYLENSQYSSAITEFKKALRANPADKSALIGLSNAYNMRAQYYNNTVKATDNAISDLKSAIFYIKYIYADSSDTSLTQSVNAMEKNLSILEASKQSLTSATRFSNAKNLRTKGEFAAAGYDYHKLLADTTYKAQAASALGDIYNILNQPKKASSMYSTALALNPDNSELHLKLARTYEQMDDASSALKEYSTALDSSTESEDILASLEKIWQKKVDENPNDAESHANLGVVLQKEKRYMEALQEYRCAQTLNPTNINTKINIGTLCQELKNYENAVSVYDEILKLQPHNVSVMVYKAECLTALNKNSQAIELYKTAVSLEPNNSSIKAKLFDTLKKTMTPEQVIAYMNANPNFKMDADSYYQFAYELHKNNKLDEAITYYNETLKLDSKKVDAYINLSQVYRQKQNYNEALNVIQKAMAIAPANTTVKEQYDAITKDYTANSYTLASNAFESGEYQKAIEEYRKITPPSADSYTGIAASYQALNNTQEALNYYKKALDLSPKNSDLPFYIASLYVDLNDMTSAKQYAKMSLARNQSNKQAKELLTYIEEKETADILTNAVSLYENKKYTEAVDALTKVITAAPNNANAYYYRAMCYDELKKYENAISDYKSAVKYAPDMSIVYYSIAVDYDALKNFKSAKENYKKYVELNTEDNDYKKYAQSRIDEIE